MEGEGGTIKFDCKTEPLAVVGCLSVVCGLTAQVAGRLLRVGWSIHGCAAPLVVLVAMESLWRRHDRAA
jgi:hypothetical protein